MTERHGGQWRPRPDVQVSIGDKTNTTNVKTNSREQLEVLVKRLKTELSREREERNFYQMERDRMDSFWEVTQREIGELKAEVRLKDR